MARKAQVTVDAMDARATGHAPISRPDSISVARRSSVATPRGPEHEEQAPKSENGERSRRGADRPNHIAAASDDAEELLALECIDGGLDRDRAIVRHLHVIEIWRDLLQDNAHALEAVLPTVECPRVFDQIAER